MIKNESLISWTPLHLTSSKKFLRTSILFSFFNVVISQCYFFTYNRIFLKISKIFYDGIFSSFDGENFNKLYSSDFWNFEELENFRQFKSKVKSKKKKKSPMRKGSVGSITKFKKYPFQGS